MKRRVLLALLGTAATTGCSSVTGVSGTDSDGTIAVRSEYNCVESREFPCTASVTVDKMGNANQFVATVTNASGRPEAHVLSIEGARLAVDGLRRDQTLAVYAELDDTTSLFTEVPTPEQRQRENTESNASRGSRSANLSR